MATLTLSILGLYNYVNARGESDLFEYLNVPDTVEKDVVVNNILMQAAPFEMLYTDADVLRDMIGIWSDAHVDIWARWSEAWELASEFNPLENFDRSESETFQHSGQDMQTNTQTRNLSGSDTRTANLTDQETRDTTDTRTLNTEDKRTADLTTTETRNLSDQRTDNLTDAETRNLTDTETRNLVDEHKVSAYDASTYSPKDYDTHTGTDTQQHTGTDSTTHTGTSTTLGTGTDTVTQTGTDTTTHKGTDTTTGTGTDTMTHTGTDTHNTTDTGTVQDAGSTIHGHKIERTARYHGNIGVTSLSQLLTSYDEAVEKWDLVAKITQDFISEFCIMVY